MGLSKHIIAFTPLVMKQFQYELVAQRKLRHADRNNPMCVAAPVLAVGGQLLAPTLVAGPVK
jgi:hypothetical protein